MLGMDLSTRQCGRHVAVALPGELDVADAVSVAAALAMVAARNPEIIVDLAAREFIDLSGVAAPAGGPKQAWHARGDLLLAASQLRVLTLSRPIDVFPVHASAGEAAGSSGPSPRAAGPPAGSSIFLTVT